MHRAVCGLLLCVASSASAFVGAPAGLAPKLRGGRTSAPGETALRCSVQVEKDVDAVGHALSGYVNEAAQKAIEERGHFGTAICYFLFVLCNNLCLKRAR